MKTSRLALSMKGEEVVVKADYNVAIGALALGAALFAVKAPVPAVPITALGVLFAVQVKFDYSFITVCGDFTIDVNHMPERHRALWLYKGPKRLLFGQCWA